MSSQKKRQLEPEQPAAGLSAVAARRRKQAVTGEKLAASHSEAASPSSAENVQSTLPTRTPTPSSEARSTGRRAQRSQTAKDEPSSRPPTVVTESAVIPDNHQPNGTQKLRPSGKLKRPSVQYSSFTLNSRNSRIKPGNITVLMLRENERLLILGSFGIAVSTGEIVVSGAIIKPSDGLTWVSAPLCHAIPVLRSAENTTVEIHPDPRLSDFERLECLSPLFRRLWVGSFGSDVRADDRPGASYKIICSANDMPKRALLQELISPPEWNRKLAELAVEQSSQPQAIFICGPKSSGKSTFGKILANRLLAVQGDGNKQGTRGVAVLDIDPGQPEFSPSGLISLVYLNRPNLQAPFLHPIVEGRDGKVVRSHALAATSPSANPELYIDMVCDLYAYHKRSRRTLPLVINTPGFILGTGLDLLTDLVERLRPSSVIYMSEDGPFESVEALKSVSRDRFSTLPSQQSEYTSRTAAHLRQMQVMSYFHLDLQSHSVSSSRPEDQLCWNSQPLTAVAPWLVRYDGSDRGFLGLLFYGGQPNENLITETITGSILAVVEIEEAAALASFTQGSQENGNRDDILDVDMEDAAESSSKQTLFESLVRESPDGIPLIPNPDSQSLDPRYSRVLGLVLLRGIDTANSCLHILTPVEAAISSARRSGRQIVLVHGEFDTPTWAYTEDLYNQEYDEEARATHEQPSDDEVEVDDRDTDDDDSSAVPEDEEAMANVADVPWVEVLRQGEKRPVGSRVWRVRRDLGRSGGAGTGAGGD